MEFIVICGFSGAGKSSLLNKISQGKCALDIIDLDQYVFQHLPKNGNSLGEFIEKEGLLEFRSMELDCLKQVIRPKNNSKITAIALGGGALGIQAWNLINGRADIRLIWLSTPFEICWDRIKNDSSRPLTRLGEEKMRELYEERLAFYQKAHLKLDIKLQNSINNSDDLIQYLNKIPV